MVLWAKAARRAMEFLKRSATVGNDFAVSGCPSKRGARAARIPGAPVDLHAPKVIGRASFPLNIVITPDGDAKILDFGLAKRTDPNDVNRKTLQAATASTIGLAGTMPYMAPEQLEGTEATARSDIWALGIVLYEMAAGARPFKGDNLYRLCTGIIQEPFPPLGETVPPGLAAVIGRCLEKEPARRYQRAGEVRAALEALEPLPQRQESFRRALTNRNGDRYSGHSQLQRWWYWLPARYGSGKNFRRNRMKASPERPNECKLR